jgi:predicted RNA-binding Zn ribbon-like protein
MTERMTDGLWRGVVPPYRILDPALRHAEALLPTAFADVCAVLPDERTAARRLNGLLAAATPRVELDDGRWRLTVTDPVGAAATALALLTVTGGWRRLKRCVRCGRAFVDRTNGATRRGCADHPARRPRHPGRGGSWPP